MIIVKIQVVCALYKLAHGVECFSCCEHFAISKSYMCIVLCEFVVIVTILCKQQISWPQEQEQMMKGLF